MQFKINSLYTHPQVLYRGFSKCQAIHIHPFTTKSMIFSNSNSKVTPTSLEKWTYSNSSSSRAIQSLQDKWRFCLSLVIPTQVCLCPSQIISLETVSPHSDSTHSQSAKVCSCSQNLFASPLTFPQLKHIYICILSLVFMSPSYLSCARALGAQHVNREDY